MGRMEGKIAVVTGVGSGLGRAIAEMWAKEGAKIVGADFNPAEGQKTIDAINAAGGEATFVETNLRVKADVDKLYNVVMEKYGTLTTLANCAGVLVHKHFLDHNDDDYDFISETNMRAYIWTMQKFLPLMTKENSHGKNAIVNIASISSIKPETDAYYYGAFKAAIDLMTRNLTREFSPKGVHLNVICPGPVTTAMTPKEVLESPEIQADMSKNVCSISRLGKPEDIAYGYVYLSSDEADFVSGTQLAIDGCYTAQ